MERVVKHVCVYRADPSLEQLAIETTGSFTASQEDRTHLICISCIVDPGSNTLTLDVGGGGFYPAFFRAIFTSKIRHGHGLGDTKSVDTPVR